MLRVANLTIGFDDSKRVIADAQCRLEKGERLLICGAAGSGKTTLLQAVAGLIPRLIPVRSFSGSVEFENRPLSALSRDELFGAISFVSQNVEDQLWDINVEDVIAFPMENRGLDRLSIRSRLTELIKTLNLSRLCGRRMLTLSGGERRMVAIAAALAVTPVVLVLDEPTMGLDPESRVRLSRVLEKVTGSISGLLVSEQDPTSLGKVIDTISLLKDGSLSAPYAKEHILPLAEPWLESGLLPPNRSRQNRIPSSRGRPLLSVAGLRSALLDSNGRPVLNELSLGIEADEIVALIGRNGAGKTTFFKSILGLSKTSAGSIAIDGVNADRWSPAQRARKIAYMPQNMRHILFNMTVIDEVIFAITSSPATPTTTRKVRNDAGAALERYGLSALSDANPFALSTRQQALLGLACADAARSLVAIIDEPILAKDINGRRLLNAFLRSMQDSGRSVMLISHDLELVDDVSTRLVILDRGSITFDGGVDKGWQSAAFAALDWTAPYALATRGAA
jgi:energy-coupling factor transport system ATP-binding protein